MARSNWVVEINTDDADPISFGPYTEARAEELAEKFNAKVHREEFGYIHATAMPIQKLGIRAMLKEFGS